MKTLTKEDIRKSLKNKKIFLASFGCKVITSQEYRDWQPIFKRIFQKLIILSLKNEERDVLNKKFLEMIKKEKPDYLLACPAYYELSIDSLIKMKKINPKMKTIIWCGDDELRFDDWSRYYALFFDYILTGKKELSIYKKDKIKNASFMIGVNPKYHRPINIKKIYDVSFIGSPLKDRYDYIKFLKDNGVNTRLFGGGWDSYSDLKDIYGGFLDVEDFIKVINQTKINLNFSKTFYKWGDIGQMKGRPIEIFACGSFVLNEYTPRTIDFLVKKNELNFRTKEELLEKIKYYLKNEDEREKLTEEAYKHILKNYVWDDLFQKYFERIEKDKPIKKELPKINKKIVKISENEINLPLKKIKEKLKKADYISFSKGKYSSSAYKDYFQSYSLYISKKQISCCDYYVYSKALGNYLAFFAKKAFNTLHKKDFYKLLNINQLATTKDYFIKNLDFFRKLFKGKIEDWIKEEDIVFVSIPLLGVKEINSINHKDMKDVFRTLFFDKIFSLFYQKKLFDSYIFKLFITSYSQKSFVIKYLLKRLFDKENWKMLAYFN